MPRCFYCTPLPPSVGDALAVFADQHLRSWLLGWRLTTIAAEDLHLTLRFFAEAEGERLSALERGAALLAARAEPVELASGRLACWPGLRQARVVVMLLEGGEALGTLASRAEDLAHELGFAPERRPFRAHLTLARVREAGVAPRRPPPVPPSLRFRAESLALWETLPPGGARRYRERLRLPLSGSRPASA